MAKSDQPKWEEIDEEVEEQERHSGNRVEVETRKHLRQTLEVI